MKDNKILRRLLWFVPLLAAILLLEAGAVLWTKYAWADWKPCPIDAVTVNWRNEGLSHVRGLRRCKSLQFADLRGNDVTVREYQLLRKALPDCVIRWDVPVCSRKYDSASVGLELQDLNGDDWENLLLFEGLQALYITECSDYDRARSLQSALPNCDVGWNVALGDDWAAMDSTLLRPGGDTDYAQLAQRLGEFPALGTVRMDTCALTAEEQRSLMLLWPEVTFVWPVSVCGKSFSSTDTVLRFGPGETPDPAELEAALPLFYGLEQLDLSGCGLATEELKALREGHPELDVFWEVTIAGKTFSVSDTEIDLSGIQLGGTAELEAALPYFYGLEKVVMCDCGLDSETMAALNERYENIRFVWRVYFGNYSLRTDATSFIPAAWEDGVDLYNGSIWPIRYCTELRGLDLGHMYVTDLSFLYQMPHMQYLILADAPVSDLTPLSSCKELKYLEVFHTNVSDLTPLLECTALEDLNVSYTSCGGDAAYEVLRQMTWLQRLWYCSPPFSDQRVQELQALMPDCEMYTKRGGEATGSTWRYHDHYYAMRDLFGMYYMPGGTNGVDEDGNQIIVDDEGREHHLIGWDGNPKWWEQYW